VKEPQKHADRPCPTCGAARTMTNGAWLRWKRQRADLGLREMGRRVGFTAVYLSDIERGNRNCPPKVRDAYDRL
jgi:hypothetical protein